MKFLKKIRWTRIMGDASLLSTGFLVAFIALGLIGPVSFGGDTPAWVQAVGSVAAIVFAVLVPRWHRAADKSDRERKEAFEALALAAIVMRELEEFRSRINKELWKARAAGPHSIIEIEAEKKTIPQSLWDTALDLPKLGDIDEVSLHIARASPRKATPNAGRSCRSRSRKQVASAIRLPRDRTAGLPQHLNLMSTTAVPNFVDAAIGLASTFKNLIDNHCHAYPQGDRGRLLPRPA